MRDVPIRLLESPRPLDPSKQPYTLEEINILIDRWDTVRDQHAGLEVGSAASEVHDEGIG